MVAELEDLFPQLRGSSWQITSPRTDQYNCIAWAAECDTQRWWWPVGIRQVFWPAGVPRSETIASFLEAFASLGYVPCQEEAYELGFEKIALFATNTGFPTHAARQLSTGRWTSKLGKAEDIEHALHDLEGVVYGSVVQIMKRPISNPTSASDQPQPTETKP